MAQKKGKGATEAKKGLPNGEKVAREVAADERLAGKIRKAKEWDEKHIDEGVENYGM